MEKKLNYLFVLMIVTNVCIHASDASKASKAAPKFGVVGSRAQSDSDKKKPVIPKKEASGIKGRPQSAEPTCNGMGRNCPCFECRRQYRELHYGHVPGDEHSSPWNRQDHSGGSKKELE